MNKEYEELELIGKLVDRIDSLRVENGFSIYELALKSDVSINTIKYLYKKKSFPTILYSEHKEVEYYLQPYQPLYNIPFLQPTSLY